MHMVCIWYACGCDLSQRALLYLRALCSKIDLTFIEIKDNLQLDANNIEI